MNWPQSHRVADKGASVCLTCKPSSVDELYDVCSDQLLSSPSNYAARTFSTSLTSMGPVCSEVNIFEFGRSLPFVLHSPGQPSATTTSPILKSLVVWQATGIDEPLPLFSRVERLN